MLYPDLLETFTSLKSWLTDANEIDTKNLKSTWPMHKFCIGDQMRPIFLLLALGFALGVTQILVFTLRVTQNSRVEVIAQRDVPAQAVLRRSGI